MKEGPNKGRLFWVCSKPQDANCDFFEWADEPPRNAGGGGNTSGSGSQAGPSSGECYKVFGNYFISLKVDYIQVRG